MKINKIVKDAEKAAEEARIRNLLMMRLLKEHGRINMGPGGPSPHYVAISEAYNKIHACCPKCGGTSISQTTAPWTNFHEAKTVEEAREWNHATCACGWQGITHDLVPKKKSLRR